MSELDQHEKPHTTLAWSRYFRPLSPLPSECPWLPPPPPLNSQVKSHPLASYPESPRSDAGDDPPDALVLLLGEAQRMAMLPGRQKELTTLLHQQRPLALVQGMQGLEFVEIAVHNPTIAAEVLISLASANYSSAESGSMQAVATEYIWQLCEDDITLTTLECMTSILAAVEPPPEALSKFASKCINLAETHNQARMVRLVIAFLTQILDRAPNVLLDIISETQAFCIQFSRYKEATTLFQRLIALED